MTCPFCHLLVFAPLPVRPVSELAPLRTGQSRPEQRVIVIHTRVALDPSKQDTYEEWAHAECYDLAVSLFDATRKTG